jgi:hypothetical protein
MMFSFMESLWSEITILKRVLTVCPNAKDFEKGMLLIVKYAFLESC